MNSRPLAISVIIPTLNEELSLVECLRDLLPLAPQEIIVADGGSGDRTLRLAAPHARIVHAPAGRGTQLNAGAAAASGDVLLFLHADVRLEPDAFDAVRRALHDPAVPAGNFDIRYEGRDRKAAVFTWINRWRRWFGVFYGDSGIFCRREVFRDTGGYRPWPILEDYEFGRRLWKLGNFAALDEPIHVSARRWRNSGLLGTLWSWFWVQGLYLAGVSPYRLARMYRHVR